MSIWTCPTFSVHINTVTVWVIFIVFNGMVETLIPAASNLLSWQCQGQVHLLLNPLSLWIVWWYFWCFFFPSPAPPTALPWWQKGTAAHRELVETAGISKWPHQCAVPVAIGHSFGSSETKLEHNTSCHNQWSHDLNPFESLIKFS